jgi:hypothetical protein
MPFKYSVLTTLNLDIFKRIKTFLIAYVNQGLPRLLKMLTR